MHENDALISVIVPVYNVESTLDRCITSIVEQTYFNLEIILVDDGSPDWCPLICDEWARKDSRIRVIHQENGGLSAARNAGLNSFSGQYVAFIDSDDWVDANYIECLYGELRRTCSDVALCSVSHEKADGSPLPDDASCILESGIHDPYDCLRANVAGYIGIVAWNKLYEAHIWKSLRFPVGRIHEDEYVIHHVIEQCSRIVWVPDKLYHYVDNAFGIMGAAYSIKRLDRLDAWIDRVITLQQRDNCADIVDSLFEAIIKDLAYSEALNWSSTKVHSRLRSIFKHFRMIEPSVSRCLSKKHLVYYWGLRVAPFIFWRIRRLLKR